MNQVSLLDHLFHFLFYFSNGIAFAGRVAEQLHFLSEVVVLLHGSKWNNY